MRRRRLLVGLGIVCAALWVVVAVVALTRDGGDDDGSDGDDEDLVAQLLSAEERELLDQAVPDPACASEPTARPDDDALVAVEIVRVDGTCLDAVTEYVAQDQVESRLAELDDDPQVIAAAVAPPPPSADQLDDDRRDDQWALDQLGADEGSSDMLWPDGTGLVVAVLDSGVDAGHPDLGDAVVGRRHYADEDELDPTGHGTGVAGIVAARRGNGGMVGVTPGVSILDAPVTLKEAEENPDSWRAALPWAVNHGADAVNMSLGQPSDDFDENALKVAVTVVEFALRNDVVVVASGGNCGDGCDGPRVPASLPGIVAVGALQKDRDLAGYSARNEDVDLVAPGGGTVNDLVVSTEPGDGYQSFNGTSAAAPHVAALAVAARMAFPEATGDEVAAALIDTAKLEGVSEQDRDEVGVGHGLVDIGAAIEELRSTASSSPPGDLAASTQAAYVSDGTLYAFDGDTSHPVREVGDDHSVQSVVWSDDHATLVGVDDTTLFSWSGPGSDLVETECQGCAYNELAYLTDASAPDAGGEGPADDVVVTLADDGTLTRWSAASLEQQGTVALGVDNPGEGLATLHGSVGGMVLVNASGGVDGQHVLWTVDPVSGEGQASHEVIGDWASSVAVDAAATRVAYVNGAATDDTCASQEAAIVLDAATLAPVAQPLLPRDLVFQDLFFNGDTLYATAERIEQNADGQCPTAGSAGLWRADGDSWEQVDDAAVAAARPLEGMTGEEPDGWLVVSGAERGHLEPRSYDEEDLGPIDFGSYAEGLWSTPTREEVPRGEDVGGGGGSGGGGGGAAPGGGGGSEGVDGAIARYEEFLHALGEEDIDTVCEIAGPAAQIAEDEGFGPCEQTFGIVFDMISDEQHAALREATIDPAQVEESDDGEVFIPVEAIVADVTFTEEDLGSTTLRYQDGDWFIVE